MTIPGNYAKHASIWDWAHDDRVPEFEFWRRMGLRYGNRVLSVMSAIGETAAYMARRGFTVTALDITKEMVDEGRRRFGDLETIRFIQADARHFSLDAEPFDFAFIGSADLHHLLTPDDIKTSLNCISSHLHTGGGLGLELWYDLPGNSWRSPRRVFHPFRQAGDVRIWKEGYTEYNSENHRITISQEVFVQRNNHTDHFTHEFELQLFSREFLMDILSDCGYLLNTEYGDYSFEPWTPASPKWIVEAKKK